MERNINLKKLCYLGIPLLLTTLVAKGEPEISTTTAEAPIKSFEAPNEKTNDSPFDLIDTSRFATQTIVDTEQAFEAILFDYQSQENFGHLYWNQNKAEGKIEFDYGGIKEQIDLQIADLETMTSSERYQALLQGLIETGTVWISQYTTDSPLKAPKSSVQADTTSVTPMFMNTHGYFDGVRPKQVITTGAGPTNLNRRAWGWTYDPDRPLQSIWVHIYGAPVLSCSNSIGCSMGELTKFRNKYTYLGAVLANVNRPDVNRAGIPGRHGWIYKIPEAWDADAFYDSKYNCIRKRGGIKNRPHIRCEISLKAYGIDISGDNNTRLHGIHRIKLIRYTPH
jgi:hypothetical protein